MSINKKIGFDLIGGDAFYEKARAVADAYEQASKELNACTMRERQNANRNCQAERAAVIELVYPVFCKKPYDLNLKCQTEYCGGPPVEMSKTKPIDFAELMRRCNVEQNTFINCISMYEQKLQSFLGARRDGILAE